LSLILNNRFVCDYGSVQAVKPFFFPSWLDSPKPSLLYLKQNQARTCTAHSHIDTPDIDTRKSRSHTRDLLALDHEMDL